ncbi:trypsin-like peptidase domain-containing protein [Candidatus Peregrinibacteria bacterium]|nr:trypsin-like peptidase domain-containing protein [Candidatus Peregrinibacteria bacterium]
MSHNKHMGWGIMTLAFATAMVMGTALRAQESTTTAAKPEGEAKVQVVKPALPTKAELPSYLQNISVTISAGFAQGSGTLYSRDGYSFVWTAGHVVDGLRRTREVIDPVSGTRRTLVEFDDAKILTELREDGRTVGRVEMDARVLRFSDSNHGDDLAVLQVRKKDFVRATAVFYTDGKIPEIGTDVYHVGSLLGQLGSNSMTKGIVSQLGRVHENVVYDQTTATAFPGSSGGGVYLEDGRYVGMIVRGAGEGFNLMVPVRRMSTWAKSAKVEWAMDPNVPLPSQDELKKLPVEDVGAVFPGHTTQVKAQGNGTNEFKFWIRDIRPMEGSSSSTGT